MQEDLVCYVYAQVYICTFSCTVKSDGLVQCQHVHMQCNELLCILTNFLFVYK